MRYLGLDLGSRTLGLALSDPTGMIATSLTVLRHREDYNGLAKALEPYLKEYNIEALVLGFPKNMNNTIGPKGELALRFQTLLEDTYHLPVYLQDERLSTVEATQVLLAQDASRAKRKQVVDGVAATIILQSFLDKKRRDEEK